MGVEEWVGAATRTRPGWHFPCCDEPKPAANHPPQGTKRARRSLEGWARYDALYDERGLYSLSSLCDGLYPVQGPVEKS